MTSSSPSPSFWKGRRVFVTGHTGFKGAWLCLLLRHLGATVRGYALPPPTDPSLFERAFVGRDIDSVIGDVRDDVLLDSALREFAPQVVLHMAARSVVLDSYREPVDTFSTNVMGTVNLLDALRRAGMPMAVVNVTTDKVYRQDGTRATRASAVGRRFVEGDPLGGRDPYANSKACAELATQSYVDSFFPPDELARHGVAVATARAGNVIGGGDWTPHQLVPAIVAAVQAGRPVELRHPDAVRPWQHVLDCLHGYLHLAQRLIEQPAVACGAWNIGPPDDEVFTVAQVAEGIAAHWGVKRAWTRAAGEHPHEEHELRLDVTKAERELGWRGMWSVREAIDRVAGWNRAVQRGRAEDDVTRGQIDDYLARRARTGGEARA